MSNIYMNSIESRLIKIENDNEKLLVAPDNKVSAVSFDSYTDKK